MAALTSSKGGLPSSSSNWPGGNPLPGNRSPGNPSPIWAGLPDDLVADLAKFDPASVSRALDRAIVAASGEFADGITAYRHHPYRRADDDIRSVWRSGGTALLDHAAPGQAADDPPVLFVPSLVNRGWVLDLVPGQGMLSWLSGRGLHPYRVEWGAPGPDERNFAVADYVIRRLEPAIDAVRRLSGRPPLLAGYCMGGLLALAAAVRRPEAIAGLALLATPWDFHADGAERARAIAGAYGAGRSLFGMLGEFPIDVIQGLFAAHDPIVALRKFRKFAKMNPSSIEARNFVALEDWLNEGVALTLPVADEAFVGWYGANLPGRGEWSVGGSVIDPAMLKTVPMLAVVPGGDRLVPPKSAEAVLVHVPHGVRLDLPLGHIGMVVGRQAEASLWQPLAAWMTTTCRGAA